MRFGFALMGIAALMVAVTPVRSEAKKKHRDMISAQMPVKLPAASQALIVRNGKIRVRNGLAVNGQSLQNKARKPMFDSSSNEVMPSTFGKGKSMKPTIKLPRIKPPKNLRPKPLQ